MVPTGDIITAAQYTTLRALEEYASKYSLRK